MWCEYIVHMKSLGPSHRIYYIICMKIGSIRLLI